MKKKTIAIITAAIMALAITACGSKPSEPATAADTAALEQEIAEAEPSPAPTEEPVEESTEESADGADTADDADDTDTTDGADAADTGDTPDTDEASEDASTDKPAASANATEASEETPVGTDNSSHLIEGWQDGGFWDALMGTSPTPAPEANNDGLGKIVGDSLGQIFDQPEQPAQQQEQQEQAPAQQETQTQQQAQAAPAPAPAQPAVHTHNWQPKVEQVWVEPYEIILESHEELQDVEVWGVQCIACGEKYENQHGIDGVHALTCTKQTWVDTTYREDGSVLVNGHWTEEGGARPYTETVQRMVTVNTTKVGGGCYENQQVGWVCTGCGEEKGME